MSATSVVTIYPTALKVAAVLHARARAGGVSLGHRLTTFPELVDALDAEIPGAAPLIDEGLATLVMHEALADVPGTGTLGNGSPDERAGLAVAARRAIGELAAACIGVPELAALAARTADADARTLGWLAQVAAAYAQRLTQLGRADRHDRDRRVLAALHRHVAAGTRPRVLAGVDRLVIAEIYDYSPVQSLIVRALIRLVGDAELVTLAQGENVDATRFLDRTWNRFVEDPAIADKVLPDFVVRGGRRGMLARVLSSIFVEPKPAPGAEPADDSVRVLAAPSRVAEVEEMGRRIHAALTRGVDAERIAIVTRDLGPYRAALADVTRRYGLPLALAMPRPLAEHGVVEAAMRIARSVTDGLPRAAVIAALESPYLRAAPRAVRRTLETSGYVDRATMPLARCLGHARVRFERGREQRASAVAGEWAARTLDALGRDGPPVAAAVRRLASLDAARTAADHAAALLRVYADLALDVPDDVASGEAVAEGAALATLRHLLADIAAGGAALGGRRMSLASFVARLAEAVAATEVQAPGPTMGGVRVLAVADARGLDFDDVFVLGLEDGGFPTTTVEDGLVGDPLRRTLNRRAPALVRAALGAVAEGVPLGRLLRSSEDRAAEDPFLFYLALSTAEHRVLLTHATHDDDGNALVRSPFVDEVVAIAGDDVVLASASDGIVPDVGNAVSAIELLHSAVSNPERHPGLLAALAPRLPGGTVAHLVRRIRTERRRERYFLSDRERDGDAKDALADAFVGRLGTDATRAARLRAMEWSATRLEELGACGFRFFAHRLLRLRADEGGAEALDAREEGVLAHRLLEAVFRLGEPLPTDPEHAAAAARALAEGVRADLVADMRPADATLFALAWARAVEAVVEVVRSECRETRPTRRLLEWPFRFAIADHRTAPDAAPLDLTLTGTIDRADLWLDGAGRIVAARVLDYKNAKRDTDHRAKLDAERAMGSTSFQIPVYALALAATPELAWSQDAEIRGGYVLLRAERKTVASRIPASLLARDPEERRAAAATGGPAPIASRVIQLVERTLEGRFDVEPRECSRFCDYRYICRYEPPPEEGE